MLKIKDNVDLKELEKFGFYFNSEIGWYFKDVFALDKTKVYHYVVWEDRYLTIENDCDFEGLDDTLYDLIKADLVEKVED